MSRFDGQDYLVSAAGLHTKIAGYAASQRPAEGRMGVMAQRLPMWCAGINRMQNFGTKEDSHGDPSDSPNDTFVVLFAKERLRIYAFILSMVRNAVDAEDLFQQTSVVLWRKFKDFDQDKSFYSWACGIAFREVLNFRRLSVNHRVLFSNELVTLMAEEHIEEAPRTHDQLDLLEECLGSLSQTDTQIIHKVYRDEWPVRQVAESMNKASQTIYNRLNLIRAGLLECINRKRAARSLSQ